MNTLLRAAFATATRSKCDCKTAVARHYIYMRQYVQLLILTILMGCYISSFVTTKISYGYSAEPLRRFAAKI